MDIGFNDVEFMTANEKQLIVKNWKTFLKHGLKQEHFTRRLYQHLHLHCGFIAHYNIKGFNSTYFEAGADTERFFEQFCDNVTKWGAGDYHDLNTAMMQAYREYEAGITAKAQDDIKNRLDVLDACVQRSKKDCDFAREFITRL